MSPKLCRIALVLLVLAAQSIRAGVNEDVHQLLVTERFAEAQAHAQAALDAAQGTHPGAAARRLDALNLLLDVAVAQRNLRDASVADLLDQTAAATSAIGGDHMRRQAKPLATAALREIGLGGNEHEARAAELIAQSLDLLANGEGEIAAVDRALVEYVACAGALTTRKYAQGMLHAQRGEALLQHPHNDWEREWHAILLARLGLFQSILGDGGKAATTARTAATLAERVAGTHSLVYADAKTYLGQVQMYNGDYPGVRDSLQVAVDIYRAHPWLGPKYSDRAINSIANAMRRLGDYDHARPLFEEVIARNEVDAQGNFEEILPDTLDTLAGLEKATGNLASARALYERALALEEKLHGESVFIEKPLINLGGMATQQNDLAAAQAYFDRAAALDAKDSGGMQTNHVREGQANLALAQGRPDLAERLMAESIEQESTRYGAQHSALVLRQCNLAIAKARQGKTDEAFAAAESGERLRIELLRRIAPAMGESQALTFKSRLDDCNGVLLALAAQTHDASRSLRAWQLVTESRGLATRLQGRRIAVARDATDAAGKQHWVKWETAARSYGDALLRSSANHDELVAARSALDRAETELGSAALVGAGLQSPASLDALLTRRPAGTALVAYIRVEHFDLDAQARGASWHGEDFYALISQGAAAPRLVALGDAVAIDAAIERWVKLLRDPASNLPALADAGRAVRAAIWEPLASDERRVFVVPDGSVFRVNFAALPEADGYLVEHGWRVHMLDSEYDLAFDAETGSPNHLLLIGAPDFGIAPKADRSASTCAAGFGPLSGTRTEVDAVARLWHASFASNAQVLLGRDANKHGLASAMSTSNYVHFATHAFEVAAECPQLYASRGVTLAAPGAGKTATPPGAALALAGANRYFSDGSADGILTSAEAVTLPLHHARWVVLAACDTGLGEVVADEGVFGLRRGFRLAGARTVVMSLWNVDDTATSDLMQALYAARWHGHADTPDALAQAQLAVLAERRAQGESTHPYYWAAFVASGDWH